MGLVFLTGFSKMVTADLPELFDAVTNGGIASSNPRRAGGQYAYRTSGYNVTLQKNIPSTDYVVVGTALYTPGLDVNPPGVGWSFGNGDNSTQCSAYFLTDGAIIVKRGGSTGTELGRSAAGVLVASTWQYWEIVFKLADSGGVVEVWADGTRVLNLTSQDTRQTGTNAITMVEWHLCSAASGALTQITDLYVIDRNTSGLQDRLGDCRVDVILPDGAGNATEWTPNAGSNYDRVDDASPDDDTTYVYASVNEKKDLYAFAACPSDGGPIIAVQERARWRKTDAGGRNVRHLVRSGGSNYESGLIALTDSYIFNSKIWEQNPADSQNWEPTDIDNAEFGMIFTYTTTVST